MLRRKRKRKQPKWFSHELQFLNFLREHYGQVEYQKEFPLEGFRFHVDFYLPKWNIPIELNGEYHYTKRNMAKMLWRDEIFEKHGLKILHIYVGDFLTDPRYVKKRIDERIEEVEREWK